MSEGRGLLLSVLLCAAGAGCTTSIGASYWLPSFANETQSGGGDLVDVKRDFGVEADSGVLLVEVKGDAGKMRGRANYWKINGAGTKVIGPADIDFANHTYQVGDDTSTTLDLTSIGAYWEPAVWMVPKHRVGLLLGTNLIAFNMVATDITNPAGPGDGEVHVPDDSTSLGSIGFVPLPVVGAGYEAKINHWIAVGFNAQVFDTSIIGDPIENASALFYGGEVGVYLGDPARHVQGFAGYRYYHVEYDYEGDVGNGTLDGVILSVLGVF